MRRYSTRHLSGYPLIGQFARHLILFSATRNEKARQPIAGSFKEPMLLHVEGRPASG